MKAEIFESGAMDQLNALFGYAMKLTHDHDRAEDLVQETYARALPYRDKLRDEEPLRPLLFRILHNLFVDQYRAERRSAVIISTDALCENRDEDTLEFLSDPDDPRKLLLDRALSDEVEAALMELEESWRQTIWLREIDGFTYEEISEITAVPIGTVRSRLARSRKFLARRLQDFARARGIVAQKPVRQGEGRP